MHGGPPGLYQTFLRGKSEELVILSEAKDLLFAGARDSRSLPFGYAQGQDDKWLGRERGKPRLYDAGGKYSDSRSVANADPLLLFQGKLKLSVPARPSAITAGSIRNGALRPHILITDFSAQETGSPASSRTPPLRWRSSPRAGVS